MRSQRSLSLARSAIGSFAIFHSALLIRRSMERLTLRIFDSSLRLNRAIFSNFRFRGLGLLPPPLPLLCSAQKRKRGGNGRSFLSVRLVRPLTLKRPLTRLGEQALSAGVDGCAQFHHASMLSALSSTSASLRLSHE